MNKVTRNQFSIDIVIAFRSHETTERKNVSERVTYESYFPRGFHTASAEWVVKAFSLGEISLFPLKTSPEIVKAQLFI